MINSLLVGSDQRMVYPFEYQSRTESGAYSLRQTSGLFKCPVVFTVPNSSPFLPDHICFILDHRGSLPYHYQDIQSHFYFLRICVYLHDVFNLVLIALLHFFLKCSLQGFSFSFQMPSSQLYSHRFLCVSVHLSLENICEIYFRYFIASRFLVLHESICHPYCNFSSPLADLFFPLYIIS